MRKLHNKLKVELEIPVQEVGHDEAVGDDMDDDVLDPGEQLHLLTILK